MKEKPISTNASPCTEVNKPENNMHCTFSSFGETLVGKRLMISLIQSANVQYLPLYRWNNIKFDTFCLHQERVEFPFCGSESLFLTLPYITLIFSHTIKIELIYIKINKLWTANWIVHQPSFFLIWVSKQREKMNSISDKCICTWT